MCFWTVRDREGTEGFPGTQAHPESAEEAEPQNKGQQEEERVSLKTAGWVLNDVPVDMATKTHLETPAPPPRWLLMRQMSHPFSYFLLVSSKLYKGQVPLMGLPKIFLHLALQ